MSFVASVASAPAIPYAGRSLSFLAGLDGSPEGFACAELLVPAHFPGPPPHSHDLFDEAIYVLEGRLTVIGDSEPTVVESGCLFVAPLGHRHGFSNPDGSPARVLGIWAPAGPATDFMRAVGVALPESGAPDPAVLQAVYEQHHSMILP